MIHDEGIEKAIEWLRLMINFESREVVKSIISGLYELQKCRNERDTLQKRVEELNGEVKKWQDICTLSDDRAIVCIGNERALRTSLNEAVKEIEEEDIYGQLTWNAIRPILRKHGLLEDK